MSRNSHFQKKEYLLTCGNVGCQDLTDTRKRHKAQGSSTVAKAPRNTERDKMAGQEAQGKHLNVNYSVQRSPKVLNYPKSTIKFADRQ